MEFSFIAGFLFYFVFLGLLAYWVACKTVSLIKSVQKSKHDFHCRQERVRPLCVGKPSIGATR